VSIKIDTVIPTAETAIASYRQAHTQMYGHPPRDLRALPDGRVRLHGLVVSADDLAQLAAQLNADYARSHAGKRPLLRRLFDWLNQ
jgi:hypothetical protein